VRPGAPCAAAEAASGELGVVGDDQRRGQQVGGQLGLARFVGAQACDVVGAA